MTGKSAAQTRVLYLGTASYDKARNFDNQVGPFRDADGCASVTHLKLTDLAACPSKAALHRAVDASDVIAVSGGNTLFAMTRWRKLGLDAMLKRAMARGAVLCGGSAGAICWFNGGHSDSRDPATLRRPNPNLSAKAKKNWDYIRVQCLGFVPGVLCCPHHDSTQSNGVPRASSFDDMLRAARPREVGIGIDNNAALVIDGKSYCVLSLDGNGGCVKKIVQRGGGGGVTTIPLPMGKTLRPLAPLLEKNEKV